MRQEQKPGLLSDWESADSAGLRTLSSPLIEFASNEYIAGRSEAESAMDVRTNLSSDRWKIFEAKLEKKRFFGLVYLRILNTKKIIENKKGVCWILEICVKIFGTEMVMEDLEFGKWLKEMKEWMKWLRRWSSSFWRSLYSGAPKLATEIERERDQRLKSTTVVRCLSSIWVYLHPFNIQWFFF